MSVRGRARVLLFAGVVLVGAACHDQAREDRAQLAKAVALFDDTKRLVSDGKLEEARKAYDQATEIAYKLRLAAPGRHMSDDELPPGPSYEGRTVKDWEGRWKEDLSRTLDESFDAMRQRTVDGELDWSSARAFIDSYGSKQLDERWLEVVKAAESGHASREGDTYVFQCECLLEPGYCATLRTALESKLAKPFAKEAFLTGEGRDLAFGVVSVTAELGGFANYRQVGGKTDPDDHHTVYQAATRLDVAYSVETHRGHSSWDGVHRLSVQAEPPDAIGAYDTGDTDRKQFAALSGKMAAQIAALEAQTLSR